jgi:RNA polymerase sigma-70 factor (ECF subfamily)
MVPANRIEATRSGFAADLPDAVLVARTLGGDADAYGKLVRRYERPIRADCYGLLGDWHAAQDAAQEAFLNAYANIASLRLPDRFGPWLFSIAHRCAIRLSKPSFRPQPLHMVPEPACVPSASSDVEGMLNLVAALPDQERAVVLLRYVQGHDVAAIAVILGSPVGTVTKQLSRAHKRLEKIHAKRERK